MPHPSHPFTEPWRTTALRTGSLALLVGSVAGFRSRQLAVAALMTGLALWFTLGGHFLELWFRNRLGQNFGDRPEIRALARILFWFVGGVALFAGAMATRVLATGQGTIPVAWWLAGLAFVGVELLVHLALRARGRPNAFDGRG